MNKLILVSNRLPVRLAGDPDNPTLENSDGGLATAVGRAAKKLKARWVGYLGTSEDSRILEKAHKGGFYPVSIPQTVYHRYYAQFANRVLWPILHGFQPSISLDSCWNDYITANQAFADEIASITGPEDTIWLHDYQLFLLPEMLRARGIKNKIGFFSHTPFPDTAFFQETAPGRRIIRSLMLADSLGFQTTHTLRQMQAIAQRLGARLSHTTGAVIHHGRTVLLGAFPIGIDYPYYAKRPKSELTFGERLPAGPQTATILSLSRLDYTKGLPQLLDAVAILQSDPAMRDRFTLRLNVIPSREEIPEYQNLKRDIESRVEQLQNGSSDGNRPVEYQYGTMTSDAVASAYRQADVFVAPSLADGMNLVAKEYLAANRRGVLVLGTGTGAAERLRGASMVDGSNPADIARGLAQALTRPPAYAVRQNLRRIVRTENVHEWAANFLRTLET